MGNAPTECSFFELLAPVQTIAELKQANIILCNLVNEVSSRSELAEGELVMVLVVQDVHE